MDFNQKLFLAMLDYKGHNSFYTSKEDRLENLINLVENVPIENAIAMSWYLSKNGSKLSPVVVNSYIYNKISHNNEYNKHLQMLKYSIRNTYTRPDFIVNSLSFYNDFLNIGAKNIPNSLKKTYQKVLESYGDLTLKKFTMKKRYYSLADLIKLFRPNPIKANNLKNKNLYKDIIENKTSLKNDTIVDILSNNTLSKEDKDNLVNTNIEKMPINQIIKNIKNIKYTKNNADIIKCKLENCLKKEDYLRFLNPYDLIFKSEIDTRWTVLFDEVLMNWISTMFSIEDKENVILFDISGSMTNFYGQGIQSGAKFLSLIIPCLKNFKFFVYNTEIFHNINIENKLKNHCTPNQIFKILMNIYDIAEGCTYTRQCLEKCSRLNPESNIFLITDEVSYDDTFKFSNFIKNPLIIYSTDYHKDGLFNIDNNLLRICGHSGNIFNILKMFSCFDSFMKDIKNKFEKEYTQFINRK